MSAQPQPRSRLVHVRPVGLLAAALAVVLASQVAARIGTPAVPSQQAGGAAPVAPAAAQPATTTAGSAAAALADPSAVTGGDTDRLRADIAFWSGKVTKDPADFVSSTEWAASEIGLARATGDVAPYVKAEAILAQTIAANPDETGAVDLHAAVLVSLHRFADARDAATAVLAATPSDATALGVLGDATLELGDVAAARGAYARLDAVGHSAASLIRLAQVAWLTGDTPTAISEARAAVASADDEGAVPERAAWYRIRLAELLLGHGDTAGATAAYTDALRVDPSSFLARAGLARIDAAAGNLDSAIARLSDAIARVPQPDLLARRSDLYLVRNAPGDAALAADDVAAVEAIARLAGSAGNVYDRNLSIFLATHGTDPARALALASAELEHRKDIFGWDADAWALLAAGRPADADAAMAHALTLGTQDARLLVHAGLIAQAVGDAARAKSLLSQGLALDTSFDPILVARAKAALAALQ